LVNNIHPELLDNDRYLYFHLQLLWNPLKRNKNSKFSLSEWLLFNANLAIFQLYYGDKLIFNRWWWDPLCTRPTRLVGRKNSETKTVMASEIVTFSLHLLLTTLVV
jgi:hypothetical protein